MHNIFLAFYRTIANFTKFFGSSGSKEDMREKTDHAMRKQ